MQAVASTDFNGELTIGSNGHGFVTGLFLKIFDV